MKRGFERDEEEEKFISPLPYYVEDPVANVKESDPFALGGIEEEDEYLPDIPLEDNY